VGKEWRGLLASRAWWIFLLAMGPLVGVSFISAVRTYGELSGLNGTSAGAAGVGEAFSPLVGIWAPTFSACEIAAVFLLPFVAIRLLAGDRQNGTLKIELQHPMPALAKVGAKAIVLVGAWIVALAAPLAAIALWKSYSGSIYAPEVAAVAGGHMLNAALTIGIALAMASFTEHPSTAAILTLAVTVGTWIVSFVAAVSGGIWERLAGYTPTAMVSEFQHGLIDLNVTLVALIITAAGIAVAAIWIRLGVPVRRRVAESLAVVAVAAATAAACVRVNVSWDASEARANSFTEADEAALRSIHQPLSIEAHLAPEDPRRFDLDHRTLDRLRRVMPRLQVSYVSSTTIGLFEQTNPHYGEIVYDLGGKKAVSRLTTTEGVLETIYSLAGVEPAAESDDVFRGHPLAAAPNGAALIFYIVWPAVVLAAMFSFRRFA
jgi:hypothetical protein